MNVADVRRLFDYTEWANAQIFAAIDGLSEEQYARTIESSFPSIKATLAHVISAEWVWLLRWHGESPTNPPEWTKGAPREELHRQLHDVETKRAAFLASLDEAALAKEVAYVSVKGDAFSYPLGEQLRHVANHSTYHRGQLITMLRQVGAAAPATDWLVFVRSLK